MYDRRISDSNFLFPVLANLSALELKQYIHTYIPSNSFRSVHYEEKIRREKLNPKDYICFALATNNTLILDSGKLTKCLDWLNNQTKNYDVIINSLITIKNFIDEAKRTVPNINKSLLKPNCYQNLHRAKLQNADFKGADLRLAMLRLAAAQNADFSFANLCFVEMDGINLKDANLSHVTAAYAELTYARLVGANLENANLEGAQLQSAKLSGARLIRADLHGANLRCANLENTDMRHANLVNASLNMANFNGANLAGAKFLPKESLTNGTLLSYLDNLERMLRNNAQLSTIRQHIAIDLANQASELSKKSEAEILDAAYNHRLFKPRTHKKIASAVNKWHAFFYQGYRDRIETTAQFELARNMQKKL